MVGTKNTIRPLRPEPHWAIDATLNDPGEAWDGNPTRVQPGVGKRDAGWNPEEKPGAQHLNQLLGEQGEWLQYLSDIQPQNWDKFQQVLVSGGSPADSLQGLAYDRGSRRWVTSSLSTEVVSSPDGYNWTDISPPTGTSALQWIASKPHVDTPTHTGDFIVTSGNNATGEIQDRQNGTWTNRTLPGTTPSGLNGVWDPSNELWLVCGNTSGSVPAMWWATPAAMTWTLVVIPFVTSTQPSLIATNGAGLSVIVGTVGSPYDVWRSTDGKAWSASATIAQTPQALAYDSVRGVFVLLTDTIVYTSADGTTWSNVGDVSPGADFAGGPHALVIVGAIWLATVDGSPEIRYATDGAGNWKQLFLRAQDKALAYTSLAYSPHHGQFMAMQEDGVGNRSDVNLSLSVGTITMTATGAESIPGLG